MTSTRRPHRPRRRTGDANAPPRIGPSSGPVPDFVVGPDMVVKIAFELFDGSGTLVDTVSARSPLRYVHGYAQVIPGLEIGLEGARAGEHRTLVLEPEHAFGERDPEALLEIDRDDFPDAANAHVGDELLCTAPDGSECAYRIAAVNESEIVADRNHPLAGERVRFEVAVLSVRPAAEEVLKRAEAEMDERIVYAESMSYDTSLDEGMEEGGVPEPQLIQLRVNPRTGSTS